MAEHPLVGSGILPDQSPRNKNSPIGSLSLPMARVPKIMHQTPFFQVAPDVLLRATRSDGRKGDSDAPGMAALLGQPY